MITIELLRKRSEHNEGEIHSLEEISLHQENLERIELLDTQCKHLKILYLQNNLISKLENLSRLKELEYLNMAVNSIERIENLSQCESLKKLDLTLNFIGALTSIENLKNNRFLEELGYSEYTLLKLPQLKNLDGNEITPSDRIRAVHFFTNDPYFSLIINQDREYQDKRRKEKELNDSYLNNIRDRIKENPDDFENIKKEFMEKPIGYAPEIKEFSRYLEKITPEVDKEKKKESIKEAPRPLFKKDNRPYNINQLKLNFTLRNDYSDSLGFHYNLNVPIYKYLDTSQIDCDVNPTYVRLTIKGRITQIVLEEEILVDKSTVVRSQTSGELVIKMPFMIQTGRFKPYKETKETIDVKEKQKIEYLEISEPQGLRDKLKFVNNYQVEEVPELI